MKNVYNRDLCIIAGGKSSRMGADKGLLPFKNHTITEEIISNLGGYFDNVFISANNPEYNRFSLPVFRDEYKDMGPLSAVYTAVKHSRNDWVMVCRCDMPFADKSVCDALFDRIKDNSRAVVITAGDKIYPVLGLYHKSAMQAVQRHIDTDNRKLTKLLDNINTVYVNFAHSQKLKNINTVQDYKEITDRNI